MQEVSLEYLIFFMCIRSGKCPNNFQCKVVVSNIQKCTDLCSISPIIMCIMQNNHETTLFLGAAVELQ